MKIAIDIRSAEGKKAGKGFYTYHLCRNILKFDLETEFILYGENPDTSEWKSPNVKVKKISARGIKWHIKTFFDLIKEKPDIFFAPTSLIIPAFLPKTIKTIVTVHDLVSILFPSTHLKKAVYIEKLLLGRVVRRAKKVCAVSENTKKDILNTFNTEEKKISVVYCGVSDKYKRLSDAEIESLKKAEIAPEKFFLSVSTIEPRKNYVNLVRAFSFFLKTNPDFKLIIVGQKGWQFEEVFREVTRLKISDKIIFPDYIPENGLLNLYNLATAFVFPSFYEGFGIPPLEAMSCGCPVIASNKSSIPEVVGDAGLLVDPKSPEDIAEKMKNIADNETLRKELREKGFSRISAFNWEDSAKKMISIFKSV
ncbi:MAG: glycosyltransferase family 1 protein [Candidatus Gracilibacteria bacterium]|jgi:glycosyltransferase involved in cell wall biosynthesis|nr:glycosyltransferase family 1 protein [Candidatus Gracilibacteria bacterium]